MKPVRRWKSNYPLTAEVVGHLEFQDNSEEFHLFTIMRKLNKRTFKPTGRLIFGGETNVMFLESGYITAEGGESEDDVLAELLEDLKVFYNDGASFTSRIAFNERM